MVEEDNIEATTVALMGICAAIVTTVVILGLQVLYYRETHADDVAKFVTPGWQALRSMETEQRQSLTGYGWVDKPSGLVHVPIDRAMSLTLKQLQEAGR